MSQKRTREKVAELCENLMLRRHLSDNCKKLLDDKGLEKIVTKIGGLE